MRGAWRVKLQALSHFLPVANGAVFRESRMQTHAGKMNNAITESSPGHFVRRLMRLAFAFVLLAAVEASRVEAAPLPAPVFSIQGGVFTNDLTVALSGPPAPASIRYTLDGSEPTTASVAYTAPIAITNSAVVRARAFAPGQAPGELAVQTYVLLEPDVIGFDSTNPTTPRLMSDVASSSPNLP